LIDCAEAGGVEPQPVRVHPFSKRRSRHREIVFQLRKVQESNPDARAPPGFRDRCLHHADLTFQRIVLAAGIEPEAGCERPGTAPAVNRGRDGSTWPRPDTRVVLERRHGTPPRDCTASRRSGGVGPDSTGRDLVHAWGLAPHPVRLEDGLPLFGRVRGV
jgi:hypothetical protein